MKGAKNMSEIQNAIEVKNLKKGFGGRVLFENFSLNVKANTIHIGIDYLIIVVDVALCMMFALLSFFKARHMSNETVIRRDGEWV